MQTLNFPAIPAPDVEGNPTLNVVIAYEDFETGKRAMKTVNYLMEHLGRECLFFNQMWKFDVLSVPKLREMAVKDAAAAQIILVAAHGEEDLPAPVKSWIESWLLEKESGIALVGLFEGLSEYDYSPAREYLAKVAERGKMEFFSQPGLWPDQNKNEPNAGWQRNDKAFSMLADVMKEQNAATVSHWGINE